MKKGDRVLVTGGSWEGYSGEYVGSVDTMIGTLYRVDLDNGMSTIETADHIVSLEPYIERGTI